MALIKSVSILSVVVGSQIFFSQVFAAVPSPPPLKTQLQRQIGGQAGSGFSLLGLQRMEARNKKQERLVFAIGNREGQTLRGLPGYFNVLNANNRIVIDFAQMPYSRMNEASLKEIFKGSSLVSRVAVAQDPMDKTLTLTLDLKGPVQMKTMQIKGEKQTARVVLDIIKK